MEFESNVSGLDFGLCFFKYITQRSFVLFFLIVNCWLWTFFDVLAEKAMKLGRKAVLLEGF